jgi:hypothetical protein
MATGTGLEAGFAFSTMPTGGVGLAFGVSGAGGVACGSGEIPSEFAPLPKEGPVGVGVNAPK